MKTSELRIGNYVYFEDRLLKFDFESGWNFDYIKPIPLTEEWLIKFGFETDNIEWWNGLISIGIYKDGLFYCPTGEISLRIGKEIQYVNQLQNLYFALTGEELILNI